MSRVVLTIILALHISPICGAATTLSIDAGWSGVVRPGTTLPVFVTVSDEQPRAAELELIAPLGQDRLLRFKREIALGPTKSTYPFLLPLDAAMGETVVMLRDQRSAQLLVRRFAFARSPEMLPPDPATQIVDLNDIFIGVSGDERNVIRLTEQLRAMEYKAGHLPQSWLPERAAGYECLNALVLDEPNLARLSDEQHEAISNWVSSGGLLIIAPSSDPIPAEGLATIFPADVGENVSREISSPSPSTLRSRRLIPRADARQVEVASTIATAYERISGKGRVILVSASLASLGNSAGAAKQTWSSLLTVATALPATQPIAIDDVAAGVPGLEVESFAEPRVGSTKPLMFLALAVSFLIGPVDWVILRRFGSRGWNVTTVLGFAGLLMSGVMLLMQ